MNKNGSQMTNYEVTAVVSASSQDQSDGSGAKESRQVEDIYLAVKSTQTGVISMRQKERKVLRKDPFNTPRTKIAIIIIITLTKYQKYFYLGRETIFFMLPKFCTIFYTKHHVTLKI